MSSSAPRGASAPAWAIEPRARRESAIPRLRILADRLSICRLEPAAPFDPAALLARVEAGWRAFKVQGPLDFGLTGILAAIASPLAAAGIPIFALSTFDTDYVLVKEALLPAAAEALKAAGMAVED